MFYLNYTNREKAYFPLPFQILSISMNSGPGHSSLSRVPTSLIDIWDDIRGLLLSNYSLPVNNALLQFGGVLFRKLSW